MSNDLKSIIGIRVKAARKGAGLTQAQLAEAVDRTVEAISNIERGKSLPPLDLLERIALQLATPLKELVSLPDDPNRRSGRAGLEMRLFAAARTLPIEQLRIAIVQIEALCPDS